MVTKKQVKERIKYFYNYLEEHDYLQKIEKGSWGYDKMKLEYYSAIISQINELYTLLKNLDKIKKVMKK